MTSQIHAQLFVNEYPNIIVFRERKCLMSAGGGTQKLRLSGK